MWHNINWLEELVRGLWFALAMMLVNWLLRAKRDKIRKDVEEAICVGPANEMKKRLDAALYKHYRNRFFWE